MKQVIAFVLLLGCAPVFAAEAGRYQAVPVGGDDTAGQGGSVYPKVLILDTQEGHLWTWSERELTVDDAGNRRYGAAVIYRGKVRPGKKAGELVNQEGR